MGLKTVFINYNGGEPKKAWHYIFLAFIIIYHIILNIEQNYPYKNYTNDNVVLCHIFESHSVLYLIGSS